MSLFYFNIRDGRTMLDGIGTELSGLAAARQEAIRCSGEILRNGAGPAMWAGEAWRMWVTDQPNGGGKTLFTLKFSAADGDETAA
jgi:hypothetical protein